MLLSGRNLRLALLSGTSLMLELALTRLFSAVYYPPYVFAILSLAVLGIGLGAALAAVRPAVRDEKYQGYYALGAALGALVVLLMLAYVPVTWLLFVLVVIPYSFIGIIFASIFSRTPEQSTSLYMADLVGAGAGAVLSVPIMNAISPINAVFLAALLFILAGARRRLLILGGGAGLAMLVGSLALGWLRIDYATVNTSKPISGSLANGEIIASRWDAFGRTDLLQPEDGSPYRLYLDGAAASVMPPANEESLIENIGFFPFATNQPANVLVVGAGGGLDVWFGLRANAQEITAVEVNPASIDLVNEQAAYTGDLYGQPEVRVLLDEGRSLLRREGTLYDLIFLSQVVTLTSERAGYALTENTIYTVEAFQDYFAHLTDTGYVALVLYDEITLTRALSTALAALRSEGLTDAEAIRYMAAFLDTRSGRPTPLLMIGNQPFTREDSAVYAAVARQVGFQPLYLPEVYAQPPLDAVEAGSQTFDAIVALSTSDITPSTDNRPFFFQFERGIPADVVPLIGLLAAIVTVGVIALVFTQSRIQSLAARWSPVYFAALGLGFMLVEITLIQQTRLFLGHPTIAVTTTLAVLLFGGGMGSLLSGRLGITSARLPLVGLLIGLVVWLALWSGLCDRLLELPQIARMVVVAVCLLPLALLMGMPFPLGLQRIANAGSGQVALAWAVNGVATVVGSVMATILATVLGFNMVLVVGMIAYALAALYTLSISRGSV